MNVMKGVDPNIKECRRAYEDSAHNPLHQAIVIHNQSNNPAFIDKVVDYYEAKDRNGLLEKLRQNFIERMEGHAKRPDIMEKNGITRNHLQKAANLARHQDWSKPGDIKTMYSFACRTLGIPRKKLLECLPDCKRQTKF